MKTPPFNGALNKLIDAWCQWCVDHGSHVPLAEWCRYTHSVSTLNLIMAAYADRASVRKRK